MILNGENAQNMFWYTYMVTMGTNSKIGLFILKKCIRSAWNEVNFKTHIYIKKSIFCYENEAKIHTELVSEKKLEKS